MVLSWRFSKTATKLQSWPHVPQSLLHAATLKICQIHKPLQARLVSPIQWQCFPQQHYGILMRATLYTMSMVRFTPLSISPSHLSMRRLSLILPAFSSPLILLLIFKRSLWTFHLFLWCFFACIRTGDPVGCMLSLFSDFPGPLTKPRPLSKEVTGWNTGGVRQRIPQSLSPD